MFCNTRLPLLSVVCLAVAPKAVTKNNELPNICQIAAEFGSPLTSSAEIYAELQQIIGVLKQYQPATIPAEGLNLNDSEAANVTA